MKAGNIVVAAAWFWFFPAVAQVPSLSPLRITTFNRAGALAWTNEICTTLPVYGVSRANSVTGAWQHFFSVTNADSITLTNSLGDAPGTVFHKLAWASDGPVVFDYMFDEGYGVPAVAGQLTVNFAGSAGTVGTPGSLGTWSWHDTGLMIDGLHPLGNGHFWGGGITVTASNHLVRLAFTPGSENAYLEGTMQIALVNGRRTYTGMSGTVYQSGFAGTSPIGNFLATRGP